MKIRLYLAPIQGITDAVYRNTFTKYFDGFDVAVTPFISTTPQIKRIKQSHLKDVLPENNINMPIIPQVMSNSPNDFILLANRLFDLGYKDINWNLGCPYPIVAKKKRGSGLLPYPDLIESFLEKTVPVIPNRLSIKTRLGRSGVGEILRLIPIFNQYPLSEIIIHPRTGKQMYEGETNLDAFRDCLLLSDHPLVYNGDINDIDTFRDLSLRFKEVNRWMIGRGTLVNPFLPAMIKIGKDIFPEKIKKIKIFHDDLFNQYQRETKSSSRLVERMKGFWYYFSRSFQDGHQILKKIHGTEKIEHYRELVDQYFTTEIKWVA